MTRGEGQRFGDSGAVQFAWSARRALLRAAEAVDLWLGRRRQRRSLLALSDHLLKDIGLNRGEAAREARKPFWRA